MDAMKKGIRCNETRFTNKDKRDRIQFEFVTDDGNTPSSCTVSIGDIDPVTGEVITDLTFFREYYRVVDHQVHKNVYAERRECSEEEKAWREDERKRYIAAFSERWGYEPSRDDVLFHLEMLQGDRRNVSVHSFTNRETGESTLDCKVEFSALDEMDIDEPLEMQALREVAESLTGRKADVYEAMLQRAAGGKERIRFIDLARKWGVSKQQIEQDQRRIMEMVRKRTEVFRQENS